MKKTIAALIILLTAGTALAFNGYKSMYVHFDDGSVQSFLLTPEVVIKTTSTDFIVKVGKHENVYPRDNGESNTESGEYCGALWRRIARLLCAPVPPIRRHDPHPIHQDTPNPFIVKTKESPLTPKWGNRWKASLPLRCDQ